MKKRPAETPFAPNLKALTKAKRLTYEAAGAKCGVTDRAWGNYCVGEREPAYAVLLRICRELGVTPNDLLLEVKSFDTERQRLLAKFDGALNGLTTDELRIALAALEGAASARKRPRRTEQ